MPVLGIVQAQKTMEFVLVTALVVMALDPNVCFRSDITGEITYNILSGRAPDSSSTGGGFKSPQE